MGMLDNLARWVTPRQKANPAGEGNYHPGPYTVGGGILPSSWGQYLNFWQMDLDPMPGPGCSTVEACVWAYIRAIAQLPGYHQRELANGGTETVTTSALSRLLRAPNGYQTPCDFLVHLIRSLLYTGNSYWIAQRNDRQEVEALHWTDPRSCRVREVKVQGQVFAEMFYEISDNPLINMPSLAGNSLVVPARDVLHVKLDTRRNPLIGETWLSALCARDCDAYGNPQFGGEVFQQHEPPVRRDHHRPAIKTEDRDELRARWEEQAKGLNAGGTPILTHGMKFQPISISNEDAQIVDQLKLNDRTIASVFGVPAILLGITDTATQKSAEALMTEWLASGLGFIITHIEQAFDKFIGLARCRAGGNGPNLIRACCCVRCLASGWTAWRKRRAGRHLFAERGARGSRVMPARQGRRRAARSATGGAAVVCNDTACTSAGGGILPVPVPVEDDRTKTTRKTTEEATDRALRATRTIAMRGCAMPPNV